MGQTYQSIIINAPVNEVWERVKNFHDLSWAPNVITKVEQVGTVPGSKTGSKRILNDAFHETLLVLDEDNRRLKYSIDEGPSPISSKEVTQYRGQVKLSPVSMENSTFIEWSSEWKNNNEEAYEFCHGIYKALLTDLKNTFLKI